MNDVLQLLLVGGVFFLIMRFGCGSHLFGRGSKGAKSGGHGGGCCGGGHTAKKTPDTQKLGTQKEDPQKKIAPSEREQPTLVQQGNQPPLKDTDPVCGMEVETKTAKSSVHDGLVYFFCSPDCRDNFEASPEKYIVSDPHPEH